ncbi:putative proline-rich receptor-like protein kinase PERK13 [Iris pallida]|uniref:Proline-rich receptor-like protein kinase PERK13 n=1 Tax=Iris pallida TaxID=29817 RepID=A0AAX6FS47_IRIPA|nr:putative proline-rich receptor-like protein kinase PERK13 [Iris pallida]
MLGYDEVNLEIESNCINFINCKILYFF